MIKLMTFFSLLLCNIFAKEPPYISMSHKINNKFVKELKQKGFTKTVFGGEYIDKINCITFGFSTENKVNVEMARKLGIELVEELLERYLECPDIQPYLSQTPFKVENINIIIEFPKNPAINDLTFDSIALYGGFVYFRYSGNEKEFFRQTANLPKSNEQPIFGNDKVHVDSRVYNYGFTRLFFETYDESYEIVYGCKRDMDKKINIRK